jgi:hypothetical protein
MVQRGDKPLPTASELKVLIVTSATLVDTEIHNLHACLLRLVKSGHKTYLRPHVLSLRFSDV